MIRGNGKTIINPRHVETALEIYIGMIPYAYGFVMKDLNFAGGIMRDARWSLILTPAQPVLFFPTLISLIPQQEIFLGIMQECFVLSAQIYRLKNSKVVNVDMENMTNGNKGHVGAIGGILVNALVYRVSATGTIKKFNRTVGGLAGQTYQYGRIRESYSEVNLIMDPTFDASVVGGIVGSSSNRNYIYDSYAKCTISSDKVNGDPAEIYMGGIVGSASKFFRPKFI